MISPINNHSQTLPKRKIPKLAFFIIKTYHSIENKNSIFSQLNGKYLKFLPVTVAEDGISINFLYIFTCNKISKKWVRILRYVSRGQWLFGRDLKA